ncbi:MAG TPA: hypothetical protein VNH11_05445 [Pirellulales bacterium]|nr:hypothetical protein [Pirellulales bacterium]
MDAFYCIFEAVYLYRRLQYAWPNGRVAPTTIELPVVAPQPKGDKAPQPKADEK